MIIRRRDGSFIQVLLDPEDVYRVLEAGPWGLKPNPKGRTSYVHRTIRVNDKKTTQMLHRWLLDAPANMQVDHINGNGLDNRRCNLRLVCQSDNKANARIYKNNSSGFKGVTAKNGKWLAQIVRNKKNYRLGLFDTPEEAHSAYCRAAMEFHGEFAHFGGVK